MRSLIKLILLFTCTPLLLTAQILNIDKNEVGEKNKKWMANTNLTLSSDQQKYNVLDIFLISDVSYRHNKRRYVFYAKIDRLTDGNQKIQDAGYFQVRDRICIKKKYSWDYFLQYQWNGAWGLVNRQLAGINFIQEWVNTDSTDFFTGIGVFYEKERWNYAAVPADKLPINQQDTVVEHPRLNLTAKYSRTFSNKIDLVVRVFNQSTVYQDIIITRSSIACQLNFPVTKKVAFSTNADCIYDTHPVVPIRNFLYSFSQSIVLVL